MGTYNNPGTLHSLFSLSLSLSLPYKFHKSIFPYRGRWTGNRGLILTLARKSPSSGRWWKERRVIPVSDLMGKGKNLRFPFFDLSTIETVPAIVRYLADEYSTVARRIKFSKRTKSVPRGLVQENPVLTMFSNGSYTLFDRRLETKRAALWKDISTRYSMFYKSRWVFALWRLESANWYRYYLSRCRYFSFVTFCRWMFESSSIKFLWHVNNKDSTRGNKVVFRRWCFRNTVIDD